MQTDVTTQSVSVKEKIKLRILPLVFIVAGFSFIGTGAFLFFKGIKQPSQPPQPPQPVVFQAPAKGEHAPGQLLVKFKIGVDHQTIVTEKTKESQVQYIDKKTRKKIDQVTPDVIKDTQKYEQQTIAIGFRGSRSTFPSVQLTKTTKDKIIKRGVEEPEKKADIHGLGQWQLITVNPDVSIPDLSRRFLADPGVEAAEPNLIVSVSQSPRRFPVDGEGGGPPVPNDPYFSSTGTWGQSYRDMWGLERINFPDAWSYTTGSNDVVVAVSDTGIDYNHQDIQGQVWTNRGEIANNNIDDDGNGYIDDIRGWDFANNDNDPRDGHGHGTHVAGTVSAATNNNIGIAGINWQAQLMPVKGLDDSGYGTVDWLANTIIYAADNGADVINMSWGGSGSSQVISDALEYAYNLGVITVAAAGNSNSPVSDFFPANNPHVITVAAWCPNNTTNSYCTSDPTGSRASFSNFGEKIDVAAPGVDILSLRSAGTDMYRNGTAIIPSCSDRSANPLKCPNNKYIRASGTSMAAPHVTGLAALIRSFQPTLGAELIKVIIRQSAEDVLDPGPDLYSGRGAMNALAALSLAQETVNNQSMELVVQQTTRWLDDTRGEIELDISNIGLRQNAATTYKIYAGNIASGNTISEGNIPSMFPGEHFIVTSDFTVQSVPDLFLTVVIDAQQAITEIDETNNQLVVHLTMPMLRGWPPATDYNFINAPVIDDLDSDGSYEVIAGSSSSQSAVWEGSKVFAWHVDGSTVAGWPRPVEGNVDIELAVGDVNGDGRKEIVAVTGWPENNVYVWNNDGTLLTGWPRNVEPSLQEFRTGASLADIDGDGRNEIIVGAYAWRSDGTLVPGWPLRATYAGYSPLVQITSNWAIGDIDGDGRLELLAGASDRVDVLNSVLGLFAWHADGTRVDGWPKYTSRGFHATPAIADIDYDGYPEIIAASYDYPAKVYIWRHDGSAVHGWPQNIETTAQASPAIADLDKDGTPEIIAADVGVNDINGKMYAWHADGTRVDGWPIEVPCPIYCTTGGPSTPSIGDISGDEKLEVVSAVYDSVYAWGADGRDVTGFPITIGARGAVPGSATIADLNNDHRLEVVIGAGTPSNSSVSISSIYAWSMPVEKISPSPLWPTFHHDNQRTGRFDTTPPMVTFNQPLDGIRVSGTITLSASAIDNSAIKRVEFFRDNNVSLGTATKLCKPVLNGPTVCSYNLPWDSTSVGTGLHTLIARAIDTYGNTASASIHITVTKSGEGGGPKKIPE